MSGVDAQQSEGVALRRALLALLDLPTEHFLRLQAPLPSALLAAAAVVLLPDARAHQLFDHLSSFRTAGNAEGGAANGSGGAATAASNAPARAATAGVTPPQSGDTVSGGAVTSCRPDSGAEGRGGSAEGSGAVRGLAALKGAALSAGRAALVGGPQDQLRMLRMVRHQLTAKLAELGGAWARRSSALAHQ